MSDDEPNAILVEIVETLAALRGIEINAAFERDGLGALVTEALRICEGEITLRPQERWAVRLLVRRWRGLETRQGADRPDAGAD